ncbi:hypothetical protein [Saccharothrix carnea]|uniref:hypothetical protein n=1 Tax=Saccharothrix carnea TaxID=1280637 RepID=UPI0011B1FD4C|nr:hypothetical protein [Saccharothrix carnea]
MATVVYACAQGLDVMPLIQTAETLPGARAMQVAAIVLGWPCPRVEVSSEEDEIHLFDTPVIDIGFDEHQARVATTAFTLASQAPGRARRVVFHDLPDAPPVVDVEHAQGDHLRRTVRTEPGHADAAAHVASRRPPGRFTHRHRPIISAAGNAIDDEHVSAPSVDSSR